MYKIKFFYKTGDSFITEMLEDTLEFEWEKLDVVKECLKRIKEHYLWYKSIESYRKDKPLDKPKWHNVNYDHKSMEHHVINIPLDNGKDVQFIPPWCGYFEKLFSIEIILDLDDIKVEF